MTAIVIRTLTVKS